MRYINSRFTYFIYLLTILTDFQNFLTNTLSGIDSTTHEMHEAISQHSLSY